MREGEGRCECMRYGYTGKNVNFLFRHVSDTTVREWWWWWWFQLKERNGEREREGGGGEREKKNKHSKKLKFKSSLSMGEGVKEKEKKVKKFLFHSFSQPFLPIAPSLLSSPISSSSSSLLILLSFSRFEISFSESRKFFQIVLMRRHTRPSSSFLPLSLPPLSRRRYNRYRTGTSYTVWEN